MTHHHLAFELTNGVESNADKNDDRGSAQRDVHLSQRADADRQGSDDAQEDAAQEGGLCYDLGDVVRGRLAGTDAGDSAAVLSEIVGNLNGLY